MISGDILWWETNAFSLTSCLWYEGKWPGKNGMSLTDCCQSQDERQWNYLVRNLIRLTICWSWDGEVIGKEIKDSVSLTLCASWDGHDWWDKTTSLTPCGLWDEIDETAWQRNKAISLTFCYSWLIRLPEKWSSVTHHLLVMGWDMIDVTVWQINKAVSLTSC